MVSEGQTIRVKLADNDVRVGTVLNVRDVEEKPLKNDTLYQRSRFPKRPRTGTRLIACRNLANGKVFSFYEGNAETAALGIFERLALHFTK